MLSVSLLFGACCIMSDFYDIFLPNIKINGVLIWKNLNEKLIVLLEWVNMYLKECGGGDIELHWIGERISKHMIFYINKKGAQRGKEHAMAYVTLKPMMLRYLNIYRCEWSSFSKEAYRSLKLNLLLRSVVVLFVGLLWEKLEKPQLYMTSDPIISPISERTVGKYFGFQYVKKVVKEKEEQYRNNQRFLSANFTYKPYTMFAKYDLSLVCKARRNLEIFLTQSELTPKCYKCGKLKGFIKWPNLSIFNASKEMECPLASSSADFNTFEAEFTKFLHQPLDKKYKAEWDAKKKEIWIKGMDNDRWGNFGYELTKNESGSISVQRRINGAAMPEFTPEKNLQPKLQEILDGNLLPLFYDEWALE